jgi:ferredoxin
MASVFVDQALCTGCGICVDSCPEVFSFDGDGKAEVVKQTCENCNLEEIADSCPADAIEVNG